MENATDSAPLSPQTTKAPHECEAGSQGADDSLLHAAQHGARDERTATLIALAQAGDRAAMGALLAEARPRAISVALKVLRNADDAEDAVQEAFLKVWRYLERFEGRSSFSTWVHRIVMNTSLDLLRRHSCRPDLSADHEHDQHEERSRAPEPVLEHTPEHSLEDAQTSVLVRAAIATLSPVHREALTLRELEDHSYEEIARASKIPVGTVMSRLHHARRKLADELRDVMGAEATLCAA